MNGTPAESRRTFSSGWRVVRLVASAARYEMRKVTAFRSGFVVRELLRGVSRPLVMICVFLALFEGRENEAIGGLTLDGAIRYMIAVAFVEKIVVHDRLLDLPDQIFQGTITKFLVMPISYFVLPFGRFVQFTLVQLAVAIPLWGLGAVLFPGIWPIPAHGLAAIEALTLALLGSYCLFLTYFAIGTLAFWLDVVWSLFVLTRFVVLFVAGAVLPPAMMPAGVQEVLRWLFPYWTIAAPIELWTGRADSAFFLRGVAVLCVSAVALEALRKTLWRRGTRRYGGSGM